MTKEYYNSVDFSNKKFDIRDYVEFDANGRAVCPNCGDTSAKGKKNLSVTNGGQYDGAYKCFKCNDTEAIREALGQPIRKVIPTALARPQSQAKSKSKYLVGEEAIQKDSANLLSAHSQVSFSALNWLKSRGISPEIAKEYKLGLARAKVDNKWYWAVSIPIPDEGKYHRKKRLVPWQPEDPIQGVRPWSQAGIPKIVLFTHSPKTPKETWLCEGEWDAMLLGWLVKHHDPENIAVASFTCGCKAIPAPEELEKLPGEVKIFYDKNDILIGNEKVGDKAAKDVAIALGERAKIAEVPMPENCDVQGWDVSDAINRGYRFEDFEKAAKEAQKLKKSVSVSSNKFKEKLVSARTIFDRAPDFVEELWTDFFSCNEMYFLAAPPRLGKSLFTLALAKAIATGTDFLGRPTKKGKVVLVSKEDAEDKLKERMIAQTWGDEEFENISFQQDFTLDDLPDLIEYLEKEKPALLVLDTLSKIRTDNLSENDSKLSKLLSPLQDTARKNEVCILIVHHTTKSGLITESREEIFNKVRGTGSFRGTCRGMIVLTEGKGCTRLVAENGRTAPKDLKIRLNPNDLIWRDTGKWQPPNVDVSQKEQVLEWLVNNKTGKVVQISEELKIYSKTTHKILTRLIAEKLVVKEGRQRNTLYYINPVRQSSTKSNLVEEPNSYEESDKGQSSTKPENFNLDLESYQNRNETLNPDNFTSAPPRNSIFVELGEEKGQRIDAEGTNEFDNSSTKANLSNLMPGQVISNVKQELNTSDNFGDTTKNFDDSVINDDNHSGFTEFVSQRENCTNKMLTGVRTKDEKYYIVIREKKDGVDCRRAGETKRLFVSWDEIEDYEYKTMPKE